MVGLYAKRVGGSLVYKESAIKCFLRLRVLLPRPSSFGQACGFLSRSTTWSQLLSSCHPRSPYQIKFIRRPDSCGPSAALAACADISLILVRTRTLFPSDVKSQSKHASTRRCTFRVEMHSGTMVSLAHQGLPHQSLGQHGWGNRWPIA